jgi:hypothetical protein
MIHLLNDLPIYCDLQLALVEKIIGDKDNSLTVKEIRSELSLCFERLNIKLTKMRRMKN